LTGKVPFDGTSSVQIIDGHVARAPTLPVEEPSTASEADVRFVSGQDIGEHSLKNVMKPIRIYRLCGERGG
jgi:hypothetical protein